MNDNNYQVTKQRLLDIDDPNCEEEEDDWCKTRPTKFAKEKSLEILQQIEETMQSDFPLGFASLNHDGGIELIWTNRKTQNEARVEIPSSNKEQISLYVWDNADDTSKLLYDPSIDLIVENLRLLCR